MERRHFITLLFASSAAIALPSAYAQGNSGNHGHGKGHDDEDNSGQGNSNGHGNGNGHGKGNQKKADRYFRDQDRVYVTRYYNGPRDLPPGQRKKLYRDGTLPPGWEKRFAPMPAVAIQQLPPIPPGYQAGYYGGYAVVIDPKTRVIYDIMDIVGALTGN